MTTQLTATGLAPIDIVLDQLMRESELAVRERERTLFDSLAGDAAKSIVLFGAGHLGRFTLAGLRENRIEPLCFADNGPGRWNTTIDGLQVLPPDDAVREFGESACFVVTIYNASSVREQLRRMKCPRVIATHPLFWKYPDTFIPSSWIDLPHTLLQQADRIRTCYGLLEDEQSKRELCEQVRWRWSLDYNCLSAPLPAFQTYFPPDLIRPLQQEVFVDCGAFDGDSIRAFLHYTQRRFRHIYGFEPDPENYRRLTEFVEGLPAECGRKMTVLPYAAGDRNATTRFQMESSAGSRLETSADTEVECRRLDDLLADAAPTHIKMDIEGAEPAAIRGAAGLLDTARPAMSVCTYHRNEHLWEIPLLIKSLAPDYRIYLRRYAEDCWETVCYAIPRERLRYA